MPIQWDEPFGLVAIESLACGTPVIAWNRAALPEIIDDGQTGFLVNSLAEMTQKISEVDKLDRRQCRRAVEERFTAARMARDYVNLYRQILEHG
jgi:glycosyltransferase involved in cell wall biosynthesis